MARAFAEPETAGRPRCLVRFGAGGPAACKGNALLTDTGCATNGFDNFEKIWFWRTPTAKCEQEGKCVPYSQWAKDYIAILGR